MPDIFPANLHVSEFDRERKRMLNALREFLAAKDVSDDVKRAEVRATMSAIEQIEACI